MGMSPLVGDEIRFTAGTGEEHGWIEEVLPRRSECLRPPVSNVTLLAVVVSPVPAPDLMLVDRLLIRARMQEIRTMLIASKADIDPGFAGSLREQYAKADAPVLAVCASDGTGLDSLREALRGETCCFAGQSGVGKTTLLNALLGLDMETGEISRRIERGRNTTRQAELIVRDGLRVFDTAGFSLLELDGRTDPVTLKDAYPEFLPYEGKCRFQPCLHDREPGCAVSAAAAEGELNIQRVVRYRELLSSVREVWRNRYDHGGPVDSRR